jgi:two-component system sensor histidine kinase EvgS
MGGHISVTSEINQGSQFDLILQLTLASQVANTPKSLLPCIVDTAEMSDKSILIVDDSDINLKVAESYLQASGAHLTLFDNGQQALQYFRANRVDIALIDLQMPGLDGLEVSRQMRQIEQLLDGPRCSIVLHTADTRPEVMATASAAGVDQCLFKPYSQSQLMQTLGLSLAITAPSSSSRLKLNHDPILNDLRSAFFQQTHATLQQCAQHIAAQNSGEIGTDLHKLMGSTSLFGADDLHQTLIEMKSIVNSEKIDHANLSRLLRLAQEQIQAYQEESEAQLSLS